MNSANNSKIEQIKNDILKEKQAKTEKQFKASMLNLNFLEHQVYYKFCTAGLSLVLANWVFAPIDRIRTIMQTNHISRLSPELRPTSSIQIFVKISEDQGAMQFFRGNMASVYKYSLQSLSRILIYERFSRELSTSNLDSSTALIRNIWISSAISLIQLIWCKLILF